ncbi:hypothetical protein DAETH_32710 (plasmid) [Deinococcus aetherius]|uniref:HTH tetR-type domain-containing protein n=1 Tax=Deinococcus aetherius TaxID=200252 RepID=A0ABM8AHW6_9DEIO|nr:hypothetical protein DAETH_32710 [Deinococcus aetherius]
MNDQDSPAIPERKNSPASETPLKRNDARRNIQKHSDAVAALFVTSGVEVPVREIAAGVGVGMGAPSTGTSRPGRT